MEIVFTVHMADGTEILVDAGYDIVEDDVGKV